MCVSGSIEGKRKGSWSLHNVLLFEMKGSRWKHARQSAWLSKNNRKARLIRQDVDETGGRRTM